MRPLSRKVSLSPSRVELPKYNFYTMCLENYTGSRRAVALEKETEFQGILRTKYQGDSRPCTLKEGSESSRLLVEDLKERFSEIRGTDVVIIDCRGLGDPVGNRALRRHLGTHLDTMKGFLKQGRGIDRIQRLIADKLYGSELRDPERIVSLVFVCKSGKH